MRRITLFLVTLALMAVPVFAVDYEELTAEQRQTFEDGVFLTASNIYQSPPRCSTGGAGTSVSHEASPELREVVAVGSHFGQLSFALWNSFWY